MSTEIGKGKCKVCGATVLWKAMKNNGKAYADCSGNYDSKACGSRVVLGATHSDNLKRDYQAAQTANNDNNNADNDNDKQSTGSNWLFG